jgi:apolipoprotein N-acyltransferase
LVGLRTRSRATPIGRGPSTSGNPRRHRPVVSVGVAAYLIVAALPPLQFTYQLLFLFAPLAMAVLDITAGPATERDER